MVVDSDNDEVFIPSDKQQIVIISSDSEGEIVISDSQSDSPSMLSPRVPATISLGGEQIEFIKPIVSPSSENREHVNSVEGAQHLEHRQTSTANDSLFNPQGNKMNCLTNAPLVCSKHGDKNTPIPESTVSVKSSVKIQRKLIMSPITPQRTGQFVPLDSLLRSEGKMSSPQEPSSSSSPNRITGSDNMVSPPCKKMKSDISYYNNNTSPAIENAHQFEDSTLKIPSQDLPVPDSQKDPLFNVPTPTSIRKVFRKRKLLKLSSYPSLSSQEDQNISHSSNSMQVTPSHPATQCLESAVDFTNRVKTEARSPQEKDTAFIPTGLLAEQENPSSSSILGPAHQFRSLSDSVLPVKEEPKSPVRCVRASESDAPRRKRKLCKSMDLDSETHSTDGPIKTSSGEPPLFYIDCDFVSSHTRDNSPLRLSFIAQLQTEGYALPYQMILDLLQEIIKTESTSTSNAICKILWSDSECFPHSTNKQLLADLFVTIIDSLMANKYSCVKNINMALQYFINILCVNWRNTTNESDSYVATFLEAKVRQLFSELRRYYDKPVELFCPHVATTLQQLTCLSLAVIHEPHRLSEFSQQVYDEVFVGLTRDKQKVFLNNLPSPYLVARLSATLLAAEYTPIESRELLWLSHHDAITTDWVSKFLMICTPYRHDGSIDLSHLLWLLTKLLTNHLQYQHGMILSSPVIVFHPLALLEVFDLSYCNNLLEDFMARLISDEVLYITCLFTPEVTHYLKLISTLLEDKKLTELHQSTFY